MLSWISLVILRDNRESSIEALQLATVYVMISISGFKPIQSNQTKNHTMNTIKVSTRSAYGQTYVDVIDDKQRGALQSLTGNSTLTQNNINSLKVLGFNFELVQDKPQDINF